MKDLEKLENELETNFMNKKVDVILEGDISYKLKIDNMKFLLNKINLIMTDDKENQIIICLDEVSNIQIKESYIEIFFNYEQKIRIFT